MMISRITARNLKSHSFDVADIGRFNVLIGANGSGKSERTIAATIATMGYVPGVASQNKAIYAQLSDGKNPLSVGVECDGKLFERIYTKTSTGAGLKYRINNRVVGKDEFQESSIRSALPKVIDLAEFNSLSNQKKLDVIFDLFPPASGVANIDRGIAESKELINGYAADEKSLRGTIERLQVSLSQITVPSTSLHEVGEEIRKTEAELSSVKADLMKFTIEKAAKVKAEEAAERLRLALEKQAAAAAAKAEAERLAAEKQAAAVVVAETVTPENVVDAATAPDVQKVSIGLREDEKIFISQQLVGKDLGTTFDKILAAFDKTGCGACFAKIVTLKERKAWKATTENISF